MIEFNPETHEYRVDGEVYPSVTQILKAVGLIDARWYKESGRLRGEAVHEVTALIDRGVIDAYADFDEEIAGFVQAWVAFREEMGARPIYIEEPRYSLRGFAGTLDRVMEAQGDQWLIDLKTGKPEDWHGIQLSAYWELDNRLSKFAGCVYLRENGRYTLREYPMEPSLEVWDAALRVYQSMKTGGEPCEAEI